MNNRNSNNNNNIRRDMLVDTHFDNMEKVGRAREDYFRKTDNVVEQYNNTPTSERNRLEMGNLIERKRIQDQIIADEIVQANAVYDMSRNPNANNIEDEINQGAERAILEGMKYHKENVKEIIDEMEEVTGNNLTRNPDSSRTLRELRDKMEHSSQRYEDWINRSEITLDQYHDVDNPNITQDNTAQPDLPVPAEFSDSDTDSGSSLPEESTVYDSDSSSGSVVEDTMEEVTGEVREESSEWVTTEESSEESPEEVTVEPVTEQVTENVIEKSSNSAVESNTSLSEGPKASKRKRDDSEDLEEEIDENPRKRLNVKQEEENVEEIMRLAQSSSATTQASSSNKRKRDDSEIPEEDKPQEKKEKTSLLDDFADTSTEPADYFGGDD